MWPGGIPAEARSQVKVGVGAAMTGAGIGNGACESGMVKRREAGTYHCCSILDGRRQYYSWLLLEVRTMD